MRPADDFVPTVDGFVPGPHAIARMALPERCCADLWPSPPRPTAWYRK